MVAGPEMSRLLAAYKYVSGTIYTGIDSRHHEATVGAQTAFFVKIMTTVLQDMGNPFQDESSELLLDTKNIAGPSLAQLVSIHHQRGLQQFEVFLDGLHNEECSFYNPIKKTKLLSLNKSSALVVPRKGTERRLPLIRPTIHLLSDMTM